MEIFYWEKAFHAGKKIRKNDFASSEKFSCYAPASSAIQCEEEINMAVASMMTCKICLKWRHMKTLFGGI